MSISSAGFRWTLSQTGARSIVAIADQPCEALSVALEESIDGYYVDTLHRAPGYEPARLETCAGDEFIAPFGGALDERIWSAIAAQIPRELEPFDPTVGSLNQYVGDGWRTREETRGQEVRVFIRAKIRWTATQDNRTLPKTQLLEINDARVPGQSEKCAAKTADE